MKCDFILNTALDSEFKESVYYRDSGTYNEGYPLTVQSFTNGEVRLYSNKNIVDYDLVGRNTGLVEKEELILYDPITESPFEMDLHKFVGEDLVPCYKRFKGSPPALPIIKHTISLHYSPKDFQYYLGSKLSEYLYQNKMVRQTRGLAVNGYYKFQKYAKIPLRRRYSGEAICYCMMVIIDTFAYNCRSLDFNANLFNIAKYEINWDKSDMESFRRLHPQDFRQYSVIDVIAQKEITEKYPPMFKELLIDSIPLLKGKEISFKRTTGANVAHVLGKIISSLDNDLLPAFGSIRGGEQIKDGTDRARGKLNLSLCSIGEIAKRTDTGIYGAIVNGGRCRNEQPWRTRISEGIDVDMSGCYSTALVNMSYPIGIPTVYCQDHDQYNNEPLSLRDFLKSFSHELIDDLYTIVVEGKLNFDQDLIPSFSTTPLHIRKSVFNEVGEEDIRHIEGEFHFYSREIVNGILTSSILNVIRKVASNKELSDFMNLRVKCAYFYPKSKRLDNAKLLIDEIRRNPGEIKIDGSITTDTRSRYWTSIPLSIFMEPWRKVRQSLKECAKNDDALSLQYKARQEVVKLYINTCYGILASPYFSVGNTVLANSITGNARVGMWLMAKSLGCVQSITDGGIFPMNEVRHWSGKKPSFSAFSDHKWTLNEGGKKRWIGSIVPDNDSIKSHIVNFWKEYDIVFPFDVEIKEHNGQSVIPSIAFAGKGDYGNSDILKKRGYRYERDDIVNAPEGLFKAWSGQEDVPLSDFKWTFEQSKLCKVGTFNMREHPVRPGDRVINTQRMIYKPLNLTFTDKITTDKWLNYWRKAEYGLEAMANTTQELERLVFDVWENPWKVLKEHKKVIQEGSRMAFLDS